MSEVDRFRLERPLKWLSVSLIMLTDVVSGSNVSLSIPIGIYLKKGNNPCNGNKGI